MSNLKQFKLWFADWEWLLREDGETNEGIEEIKLIIRNDWHDEELRKLWVDFVADQSAFRRELIAMSKNITKRIKNVENID